MRTSAFASSARRRARSPLSTTASRIGRAPRMMRWSRGSRTGSPTAARRRPPAANGGVAVAAAAALLVAAGGAAALGVGPRAVVRAGGERAARPKRVRPRSRPERRPTRRSAPSDEAPPDEAPPSVALPPHDATPATAVAPAARRRRRAPNMPSRTRHRAAQPTAPSCSPPPTRPGARATCAGRSIDTSRWSAASPTPRRRWSRWSPPAICSRGWASRTARCSAFDRYLARRPDGPLASEALFGRARASRGSSAAGPTRSMPGGGCCARFPDRSTSPPAASAWTSSRGDDRRAGRRRASSCSCCRPLAVERSAAPTAIRALQPGRDADAAAAPRSSASR